MNLLTLTSACLMGLLGGVHCISMCGGVVSLVCASSSCPNQVSTSYKTIFGYNVGRITSYALLGLLFGTLGSLSSQTLPIFWSQLALRIFAAIMMLGVGLYLAGLFHEFSGIEKIGKPLWNALSPLAKNLFPAQTFHKSFALGLLWGWLPCGLVYAALALALSSGSSHEGALTMFAFGLGTLPMLLLMGSLAQHLLRWTQKIWVRRVFGVGMIVFSILNVAIVVRQANAMRMQPHVKSCCH